MNSERLSAENSRRRFGAPGSTVDLYTMKQGRQYTLFVLIAVTALALWPAIGDCAPIAKVLRVGDSEVLECKDLTRAAIGDPLIADVAPLTSNEILVNAKMPGKTVLYIWDKSGRAVYNITVIPKELDLPALCSAVETEIADPRISVRGVGNTLILEGTVSREAEASRAEAIAQAVVEVNIFHGSSSGTKEEEIKSVARPDGDSFVIEKVSAQKKADIGAEMGLRSPRIVNLIQIEKALDDVSVRTLETANALRQGLNNPKLTVRALPGSVVLVEGKVGTKSELAQVDQLIKGWEKESTDGLSGPMGETKETVTMVNAVQIDSSVAQQVMVRAQIVDMDKRALKEFGVDWGRVVGGNVLDQPWLIGQDGTGPFDIFGGGEFLRFDPIGARVRALEEQNRAKVLSEPNLLVLDEEEGSMLVGGEIPIPVIQSGGVGVSAAVTIEYKEFGVKLVVRPSIMDENTLQLRIMPEVSSLDFTNALEISGFQIPALKTRRADTTVNIRDGQSLIIGGLLQNETAKLVKQIPVLGNLPVLGELFKSRRFIEGETELVIIISPQIVKPNNIAASQ